MNIGEVIKAYRESHGMSLQQFADKCDLSKGYIQMLEKNVNPKTGKPVIISVDASVSIAQALGLSLHALMEQVDENQPVCWGSLKKEIENYNK